MGPGTMGPYKGPLGQGPWAQGPGRMGPGPMDSWAHGPMCPWAQHGLRSMGNPHQNRDPEKRTLWALGPNRPWAQTGPNGPRAQWVVGPSRPGRGPMKAKIPLDPTTAENGPAPTPRDLNKLHKHFCHPCTHHSPWSPLRKFVRNHFAIISADLSNFAKNR